MHSKNFRWFTGDFYVFTICSRGQLAVPALLYILAQKMPTGKLQSRKRRIASDTKETPRRARAISFVAENIPFEILDGEEHPSELIPRSSHDKEQRVLLRRPKNVEFKRKDPMSLLPIMPWNYLKKIIERDHANSKKMVTVTDIKNGPSEEDLLDLTPSSSTAAHVTASQTSITIPYGFQILKTLIHPKGTIRSVFYQPSTSMFVSLDQSHVNVWKGALRIQQIPLFPPKQTLGSTARVTTQLSRATDALTGVTRWTFISKHQIYIVTNSHLQLKVLDSHFLEMSRVLTSKPVLWYGFGSRVGTDPESFEYVESKQEFLTGEVGSIKIWSIKREK